MERGGLGKRRIAAGKVGKGLGLAKKSEGAARVMRKWWSMAEAGYLSYKEEGILVNSSGGFHSFVIFLLIFCSFNNY